MDNMNLSFEYQIAILGVIISVLSFFVSGLSLFVAYLAYRRDKADVKIRVDRHQQYIDPSGYLKEGTLYTHINVANKGRRPVTLTNVGNKFVKMDGSRILGSSLKPPVELLEGKSTDYYMAEDPKEEKNLQISYFVIYDATGKEYRKYITPRLICFFYSLLHLARIRRKPMVKVGVYKH